MDEFIALANRHQPSIKFMAEISDKKITFLDTTVYKGKIFHNCCKRELISWPTDKCRLSTA